MSMGIGQLILIILFILLLFGAGKIPSVMADLAKGLRAFKKGMNEDDIPVDSTPKPKIKEKTGG